MGFIKWLTALVNALLQVIGFRPRPAFFLDWQGYPPPPQPPPPSQFDFVGEDLSAIMFAYIDADEARGLLPEGSELDPPPGTPPGKHPALYSFNFHRGIRPYFLSWPQISYLETLFGLPCLRLPGDHSGPYSIMTDLRLNDALATVLGLADGYPKHLSRLATTEKRWSVSRLWSGGPVLSATFTPVGAQTNARDLPNFALIRPMLNQRILSPGWFGGFRVSGFVADFSTAILQPLEVQCDVASPGLPGLTAGQHLFPRIDQAPGGIGAFRSLHSWQSVTPLPVPIQRAQAATSNS